MKNTLGVSRAGLLATVFGLCLLGVGVPPAAAQAQGNSKAVINKVDIRRDLLSPDFNNLHTTNEAPRSLEKWANFVVQYTTANGVGKDYAGKPGWQDEVTVEWTVLLRRKNAKDILMHRTVTYRDVEDRKGYHYADVYVRPGFIKRALGTIEKRDVYVYVQIKIADRTEAVYRSDREDFKWWNLEPPKVEIRDEELLTRDETPFVILDYDFYEQMKPKPAR